MSVAVWQLQVKGTFGHCVCVCVCVYIAVAGHSGPVTGGVVWVWQQWATMPSTWQTHVDQGCLACAGVLHMPMLVDRWLEWHAG
jgi:hypothetical protein